MPGAAIAPVSSQKIRSIDIEKAENDDAPEGGEEEEEEGEKGEIDLTPAEEIRKGLRERVVTG